MDGIFPERGFKFRDASKADKLYWIEFAGCEREGFEYILIFYIFLFYCI
jgi:hypothetical protein